jgi:hypothetical protein
MEVKGANRSLRKNDRNLTQPIEESIKKETYSVQFMDILWLFFSFWDRAFLCSSGYTWTHNLLSQPPVARIIGLPNHNQ